MFLKVKYFHLKLLMVYLTIVSIVAGQTVKGRESDGTLQYEQTQPPMAKHHARVEGEGTQERH